MELKTTLRYNAAIVMNILYQHLEYTIKTNNK